MCTRRIYDIISVAFSILAGLMAVGVWCYSGFINSYSLSVFGMNLSGLVFIIAVLGSVSLLRQNDGFDRCICRNTRRLLVPNSLLMLFSLALAAVSDQGGSSYEMIILAVLFSAVALAVYTVFTLYCYISCIALSGCRSCGCDDGEDPACTR